MSNYLTPVMKLRLPNYIFEQVDKPEWEKARRVHDWRNHVPSEIREIWETLSQETRVAIAFMAEQKASREEWE